MHSMSAERQLQVRWLVYLSEGSRHGQRVGAEEEEEEGGGGEGGGGGGLHAWEDNDWHLGSR